jgi:hypothetical protein
MASNLDVCYSGNGCCNPPPAAAFRMWGVGISWPGSLMTPSRNGQLEECSNKSGIPTFKREHNLTNSFISVCSHRNFAEFHWPRKRMGTMRELLVLWENIVLCSIRPIQHVEVESLLLDFNTTHDRWQFY